MPNCPALHKAHPINYCSYEGKPCAFVMCPRRVFEKEMREEGYIPVSDQVENLRREISEIKSIIRSLRYAIESLKEEVMKCSGESTEQNSIVHTT